MARCSPDPQRNPPRPAASEYILAFEALSDFFDRYSAAGFQADTRARALLYLALRRARGLTTNMTELGEALRTSRKYTRKLVDEYAAKGCISERLSDDDNRVILISLTNSGWESAIALLSVITEMVNNLTQFSHLSRN